MKPTIILIAAVALLALTAATARADWPHDVKWDQLLPADQYGVVSYYRTGGTAPVEATAADDFLCTETGWITDIEFLGWGSGITSFRVRFWTDVPETAEKESEPGQLLYDETFGPAGSDGLGWKYIGDDTYTYKINIPEELWFHQEGSAAGPTVYWISVQGIIDPASPSGNFSWLIRERNEPTWGDDAAFESEYYGHEPWAHLGWPSTDPSAAPDFYEGKLPAGWAKSADLCFRLTGTVPEPASMGLVCLIALALIKHRLRSQAPPALAGAACASARLTT
jgi:hypothetical protein